MVAVELDGVSARYGRAEVLTGITATAGAGSLVGLCGPNGSGKTTLLRLLLGLGRPESGQVRVLGADPWRTPSVRRHIGYLPQASRFDPRFPLSVQDLVGLGTLRQTGVWPGWGSGPAEAPGREVAKALDLVGLGPLARRPLAALSGGQMQMALLARALVGRPRLLLLDEPLSALDPGRRMAFYPSLSRWRSELGFAAIVVCHQLQAMTAQVDAIWCLEEGRMHQHRPPAGGWT